ncbi:MAG: twin-arginine translocase TatA/TatE family subunit [Burkholderiales bacterium]|nr:twin-arginine translocase TatA/TatE family subunit [Anaerolineae bacterium]
MPSLGGGELLIILAIVLLLFGVGRVSRIGGELGSAVANFRRGLDDGSKNKRDETTTVVDPNTNSENV